MKITADENVNEAVKQLVGAIRNTDTNFDKIDQFTRENEAFRENPLVSDFLAAELAFCRMMQEIGLYVTDQMRFE